MKFVTRLLPLLTVAALSAGNSSTFAAGGQTTITRTGYHGWPDSYVLSNGKVEVIVVPAVGRVMQFRFAGEEEGPFWENRSLDGKAPDPKSSEWGNFGGDKTWPSPQGEWGKVADRGWPPPPAFDSMPVNANTYLNRHGQGLILTSAVDPFFGIATERRIELVPGKSQMTISTTYRKIEGAPKKVGVWIITQLKDPVAVFAPLQKRSYYSNGFNKQSDVLPLDLKIDGSLLSCKRDPKHSTKIGTDAGTLLWVGEKHVLRIDSARSPGAEYPDEGSSAEIYTNLDPNAYVELELLGPLHTMKVGEAIYQRSTYTLLHRTKSDPNSEAKSVLRRY